MLIIHFDNLRVTVSEILAKIVGKGSTMDAGYKNTLGSRRIFSY